MELDELDRVLGVMVADQRPVDVIFGLELVRRRHRRRQMRQFGTAAAVVMIVAVGAVVIGRSGSPSIQVSTGPGTASAASTSSGCVDRPPPPGVPAAGDNVFPLTGPATTALTGGAVHNPLTLDDGTFRVDRPVAGDKPAVDLVHAECAALSGVSARGYSINYAARSNGYVIGYGRVTIRTGLTSHQPVIAIPDRPHPEGDTLVVAPTLPAAQPVYQGRLAWVVVVDDFAVYSCPLNPTFPPPGSQRPGSEYLVIVIDAATGGDALTYTPIGFVPCGSTLVGPFVDIPVRLVSVPWNLQQRAADGHSATIAAQVLPCDSYYDRTRVPTTGLAQVVVYRPFGPACGPARTAQLTLLPTDGQTTLPPTVPHGPVGGYYGGTPFLSGS